MTTLYLDLDGVLADFDSYLEHLFGSSIRTLPEYIMWQKIKDYGSFFIELPACKGALEFYNSIRHYNPIILTACPKTDYHNSALQKRRWVRENLDPDLMVLPVLGGINKPMFMHSPGDILIDDYEKNCISWSKYNGRPVHHKNFECTIAELKGYGFEPSI